MSCQAFVFRFPLGLGRSNLFRKRVTVLKSSSNPDDSSNSTTPLFVVEVPVDRQARGWTLLKADVERLTSGIRHRGRRAFLRYDRDAITRYYDHRPWVILWRLAEVGIPLIWWYALYVLQQWRVSRASSSAESSRMMSQFAQDLLRIIIRMGSIPVKIGQALASRPDVVTNPEFMAELEKLQDSVGSFDSRVAKRIMEQELGRSLDEVFSELTDEPIASASLGQVYRGRLRKTGEEVAIKVQRPDIAYEAGIDVYLLRLFAGVVKTQLKLRSDLPSIAEEFAKRIFCEIDYNMEAQNCARFHDLYADLDGVCVPLPKLDYTTRYVLTLDWIEGIREPWGDDSLRLINIGIQCTLRQLLDAGFFHADPHGGNLLRTVDGQLAYLDFGMMSELDQQKRYDLISSIVHFINRDYPLLARDLERLEFFPTGTNYNEVVPMLEKAIGDSTQGGGASNLSFARLASNMASIARASPIRLPPYYSLVIRSLTILEGIALKVDPNFKIVDSAYPYVSRRFLEDESPELRRALSEVLVDQRVRRLRWKRLNSLIAASSAAPGSWGASSSPGGLSPETVEPLLKFFLSGKGAFLQDVLINELVEMLDAMQLDVASRISERSRGFLPPPIEHPDQSELENARLVWKGLRKMAPEIPASILGGRISLLRRPESLVSPSQLKQEVVLDVVRQVTGEIANRNSKRFWRSIFIRLDQLLAEEVV